MTMMPCDEKIRLLQEALRQSEAQINRMVYQRQSQSQSQSQSREPALLMPELEEKYKTPDPNIIIIFLESKVNELEEVVRKQQEIKSADALFDMREIRKDTEKSLSDAEEERFRNSNGGGS